MRLIMASIHRGTLNLTARRYDVDERSEKYDWPDKKESSSDRETNEHQEGNDINYNVYRIVRHVGPAIASDMWFDGRGRVRWTIPSKQPTSYSTIYLMLTLIFLLEERKLFLK